MVESPAFAASATHVAGEALGSEGDARACNLLVMDWNLYALLDCRLWRKHQKLEELRCQDSVFFFCATFLQP